MHEIMFHRDATLTYIFIDLFNTYRRIIKIKDY